ncbi:MAG TPA: aminotransferase class III-fold pyridoxal phosphate-dependent enzyme, partial [Solirubrobacterales bacterium]|nr:aminotransferase class III-fold pyridoxal phosphate-dependent enzyme [Solirubrobacterales bacterium]
LRRGLAAVEGTPGVRDVRVLGAIGVVELDHPVDVAAASAAAIERGVWLRPFGNLVYAMPPYVCSADEIAAISAAMRDAAAAG